RRHVLHLPAHWPWAEHWTALWHNVFGHRHRATSTRLTPSTA
ncbi:MAG: hypothetical protein QOD87_2562, partial [Pseudonocardiales bacterium]|nr:hypothetical protein [Pseudonocardiales bacterium]